jgi:hypothetical protein
MPTVACLQKARKPLPSTGVASRARRDKRDSEERAVSASLKPCGQSQKQPDRSRSSSPVALLSMLRVLLSGSRLCRLTWSLFRQPHAVQCRLSALTLDHLERRSI